MNFDSDTNVVDVNVRRLRSKMDDPFPLKLIKTVRGVGYVLSGKSRWSLAFRLTAWYTVASLLLLLAATGALYMGVSNKSGTRFGFVSRG